MIDLHVHNNRAGPRADSLLNIIRESRMPGPVPYHYERPEGYEAFAGVQGTGFRVIEAEENGITLGFTQVSFDRVHWEARELEIAYSGDTRVSPASRGKRISDLLIQKACSLEVPVFGAVMANNSTVLQSKLDQWRQSGIDFKPVADLDACFYPPLAEFTPSKGLSCREARDSDLQEMFALWSRYARTRNLTRTYPDLDAFARDFPRGTSLQSTLLVHHCGNLIAMTGLWDQDAIRIIRVDPRSKWVNLLLSLIPEPWFQLPEAGQELKILYSYRHAWEPEHPLSGQALRLLIRAARLRTRRTGRHFFCFGIDAKDPLAGDARTGTWFRNRARIICDARGERELIPGMRPFHLEVAKG
jgi:hypothetical protein